MRTQTKCTLTLGGMLIVEILPIPFTALYSLYAIRKRPAWIPEVVENLYADKPAESAGPAKEVPLGHDHMTTRKKCTIVVSTMLLVDIVVPFTVPFGLYIVRRRPGWFKDLVARLYADQLGYVASDQGTAAAEFAESLEQRHRELELDNHHFARSLRRKLS